MSTLHTALSLSISYGANKEKVYANQESLSDHFPYSWDLNVWFRSDVVREKLDALITLSSEKVKNIIKSLNLPKGLFYTTCH